MGFGIKTWCFAALAAAVNTLAMFYASIFAPKVARGEIVLPKTAGLAVLAGAVLVFAEYIFVGRKDSGKQLMYRFVQHNVMSFACAYGGYIIYSLAKFQENYQRNTLVFNVMIPGCFQRYFILSGAAAVVCVIIWLIRRKKSDTTTDNKAEVR